mgnify:CR=1 FL=1|nr:signal recognition particle-docking protein FtsY [uncultured Cellulosilyticum sp.]
MSFFKKLFGKKSVQEAQEVKEEAVLHEEQSINHEENVHEENRHEEVACKSEDEKEEVIEEKFMTASKEMNTQVVHELQKEEAKQVEEAIAPVEETVSEAVVAPVHETVEISVPQDETNAEEVAQIEDEVFIEEEKEESEGGPAKEKKKGFMKRLFSGLTKTRDNFLKGVEDVLSNFKHIDEDLYEELEEALIMADFGVDTTLKIMDELRHKVKTDKITDPQALKVALQEIITTILTKTPTESILNPDGPTVILVIGVNGVGKTTSIGKMSHLYKTEGKKVLVAAADTFRAAAIEQLQVWCERAGVEIIKHEEGTDAAAVVFDAIAAAKSRKSDVLICDTAGRLQNKTNLMKELEKISRIIAREYPEAKKEILIALDATTGQNAIQQVKLFKEVADISGIILTKLDGTAKGGAIVGIYENFEVPVKFIGVGEKIDDLQPFDAEAFATALFQTEQ